MKRHREKVFGAGKQVPLDRNAKARIAFYARAWNARHRQPGQHKGPLTRACLEVLGALLWRFHNGRSGACFPSYERIAEAAGCCRSTVAAAIEALEFAGVLTWQHRIVRVRTWSVDQFGRRCTADRIERTSNAYQFRDPQQAARSDLPKSENPTGTRYQELLILPCTPLAAPRPVSEALNRALAGLGAAIDAVPARV